MEDQDQAPLNDRARLLEQAKEAPKDPGVYLMKDAAGVILYIGKAKNLKNRLTTYFSRIPHEITRIEFLVQSIRRFEVILTETESEALILECTLIKKHKPKYNIRLKDDKHYPYLKIRSDESFPRIEWTRKVKRDGARYFGPFPSAWAARNTLQLLNEHFLLRDCSDNTFRHRSRPCIQYQIGKCTAPCVLKVSIEEYSEQIGGAIRVLDGKSDELEIELKKEMALAAEEERFEEAAFFRDRLQSLASVTAIQVVDESGKSRYRDVVGIARDGVNAHVAVLQVRAGKLIAVKHVHIQNSDDTQTDAEVLADFLAQFYLQAQAESANPEREPLPGDVDLGGVKGPTDVLVAIAPDDLELIEKTIALSVLTPDTEAEKQLMQVALTNAKHALEQAKKTENGHGIQALEEIQSKLHLEKVPLRIECYDISNFQGDDSVASRVVFMDGAPEKTLYRRYKIKTVQGQNDFAMMKEVLGRRFSNTEEQLPDLVVVDGGRGQLAQAVDILKELGLESIPTVGLAKARTESDFQAAEVESSLERIFIPGRKNPIPLLPHMKAYQLLTHIRDEAHRFAITYHRSLRDKRGMGR